MQVVMNQNKLEIQSKYLTSKKFYLDFKDILIENKMKTNAS